MADPSPAPSRPSPLASVVRSRKGLAALFASIVGTIYAGALTVSYFQGKLSPDLYFTKLQITGGGVMAAWGLFMWGTTQEDVAAKSAPQNIGNVAGDVINPPAPKPTETP